MQPHTGPVVLRNARICASAPLFTLDPAGPARDRARRVPTEATHFLGLENPAPVGAVLRVTLAEGDQAFDVLALAEHPSPASFGERGVFGRLRDLTPEDTHHRVGSEHLQSGVTAHRTESTARDEGSDPSLEGTGSTGGTGTSPDDYAVPAPVVDPEPSSPIALREPGSGYDLPPVAAAEESAHDGTGAASGSDSGDDEPASKRRRGRKRR